MEIILLILGVLVLLLALILYSSISWGFVCTKFYVWFIISVFPTAPEFHLWQFVGFMLMMSAIRPSISDSIKDEYRDQTKHWISVILGPWLALLIGY